MFINVRIYGDSSNKENHLGYNESFEVVCQLKDILRMVKSGINGDFLFRGEWYDFCGGHFVCKPKCIEGDFEQIIESGDLAVLLPL